MKANHLDNYEANSSTFLYFNYSVLKSDTKGMHTIHLSHNDKSEISVRKQSPVKFYTIRKLQSWFKAIMALCLSCILHNGKEQVDYSLLLWNKARNCCFSALIHKPYNKRCDFQHGQQFRNVPKIASNVWGYISNICSSLIFINWVETELV